MFQNEVGMNEPFNPYSPPSQNLESRNRRSETRLTTFRLLLVLMIFGCIAVPVFACWSVVSIVIGPTKEPYWINTGIFFSIILNSINGGVLLFNRKKLLLGLAICLFANFIITFLAYGFFIVGLVS